MHNGIKSTLITRELAFAGKEAIAQINFIMSIQCRLERLPVTCRFWGIVSYSYAFELHCCRRNKEEQYIFFFSPVRRSVFQSNSWSDRHRTAPQPPFTVMTRADAPLHRGCAFTCHQGVVFHHLLEMTHSEK